MTRRTRYDVAIIGLGTMGSFAAVELARRGFSVVGFDQFMPPHGRGSHSGSTRVYRIAYPEGTGYVQLAQRAGALWDQATEQLGTQLLHRTGMLYMGIPGQRFIQEIEESASTNRLHVERLSADEVHRRYPAFELEDEYAGAFRCPGRVDRCGCVDHLQSCPGRKRLALNALSINPCKDGMRRQAKSACIYKTKPSLLQS